MGETVGYPTELRGFLLPGPTQNRQPQIPEFFKQELLELAVQQMGIEVWPLLAKYPPRSLTFTLCYCKTNCKTGGAAPLCHIMLAMNGKPWITQERIFVFLATLWP